MTHPHKNCEGCEELAAYVEELEWLVRGRWLSSDELRGLDPDLVRTVGWFDDDTGEWQYVCTCSSGTQRGRGCSEAVVVVVGGVVA